MRVSDVMTKRPISVFRDTKLHQVISILAKNKITGCPVISAKRHVVGMVAQKDILSLIDVRDGVKSRESLPLILAVIKGGGFVNLRSRVQKLRDKRVEHIMKRRVISVGENHALYDALSLLNKYNISRLPVVRNEKLIGILSRSDMIKALK